MDNKLRELSNEVMALAEGCADNVPKLSDSLRRLSGRMNWEANERKAIVLLSGREKAQQDFAAGYGFTTPPSDERKESYEREWKRLNARREEERQKQERARKREIMREVRAKEKEAKRKQKEWDGS